MNEKPSEEAMRAACEIWTKLMSLGMTPQKQDVCDAVGPILGEALDDAWQQGFADCEAMQRVHKMRKTKA